MEPLIRIVQITDTHIMPKGEHWCSKTETLTNRRLQDVIEEVNALDPDFVVHTGDITDTGDLASYEHAKELLDQLKAPYFLTCGNHDNFQNLKSVFPKQPFMSNHFALHDLNGSFIRTLILDTRIPDKDEGVLCPERIQWLKDRLEEDSEKPTLLFMHHFPIEVQEPLFSSINLKNSSELERIILTNPQIMGVYCGHYHHAASAVFGGILCWISPSTAPSHVLEGSKCLGLTLSNPAYSLHSYQNKKTHSKIMTIAPFVPL
ncbi:MAG: metallophosphoesterase [Alphaproteobacteria bacterium]